tara:strand:- start:249943 stop:250623 length:681 start_codon:yes stop_codon:yes gene_type:complete
MKKALKILMVDDHPMILEAYEDILRSEIIAEKYEMTIEIAIDCDSAIRKIDDSERNGNYDVLFLDVKLPPSRDSKILSGEDLAVYAQGKIPDVKIIILTTYNDNHKINNILKVANPDGLVIKDDLTSKELLLALDTIMEGSPYYSATVSKFFRKKITSKEEAILDETNVKIIYHLSTGVKTKDLPNHVHLSISAIEKRKVQIKKVLNLQTSSVDELITVATERGII